MTKSKLLATAFAIAALTFTSAQAKMAADAPTGMEKCKVMNAEGKNMIMENMADGVGDSVMAHQNKANEMEAWIYVPKDECAKLNKHDFSTASEEIKAKIDMSMAN